MRNRIILLFISIAAIVLFFCMPPYYNWLTGNILNPHLSITDRWGHMSEQERKEFRYGESYITCRDIVAALDQKHITGAVVLLPGAGYLKAIGLQGFDATEPAVFYYFTGHKAVMYNSPDVNTANWALVPGQTQGFKLRRIHNMQELQNCITTYKKFEPSQ